jgi:endonuclease YncB( thermonuclease family)
MYGRTLADALMADGTNVNHMLVKDGWCWSICPEADNLSTLKGSKNTGAWPRSIEAWDKLCVGKATTPFILWFISV